MLFHWQGISIANELVDIIKKNDTGGVVLKIDFEKAFNSVALSYLEFVMKLIGFGEKWCMWIMSCISTASISVLVNSSRTRELKMYRGFRQDCPLTPVFFNHVVETFGACVYSVVDRRLFKVALTLIGGVQHVDASGTKIRGESHSLLVGDPGTEKSQILKFAAKLRNRSVITTGLGSTSAGLTVTAVKDGGNSHFTSI
ncbi:Reverse transcriptase domain - like 10 [Theobroma cacao]|nr:Reverse transcriptase domain - like 10 [Theobroma cacao]